MRSIPAGHPNCPALGWQPHPEPHLPRAAGRPEAAFGAQQPSRGSCRRLMGTSQMLLSCPFSFVKHFFSFHNDALRLGTQSCHLRQLQRQAPAGSWRQGGPGHSSQPPAPCPGMGSGRARPCGTGPGQAPGSASHPPGAVGDEIPPCPRTSQLYLLSQGSKTLGGSLSKRPRRNFPEQREWLG